jgi:predicted CXXCH cytochrome family protein
MIARKVAFVSVAVVAALAAFLVLDATGGARHASADGGPHGGYTATGGTQGGLPDQCAACHRVHQGQSVGRLLKASSPYALCLTCHNGSGSVLDVLDGVRLGTTIAPISGTVRQAEQGAVTASLAPVAAIAVPLATAGTVSNAEFTLVVNRAASAPLTITLGTPVVKDDAGVVIPTLTRVPFGAAYLCQVGSACNPPTPTSLTVAAGTGVSYYEVFVPGLPAALAGDNVVIPIDVNGGVGSAPQVALSARIRKPGDFVTSSGGNSILNGGGFVFVDGKNVTSRHNADPADNSLNPWGYAGNPSNPTNTNTGQNPVSLAAALQCTSCHNPHGTENYRILKESVNGAQVKVQAFFGTGYTKDEGGRGVNATAPDKYVQEYYGSSGLGGTGDPTSAGGGIATLCGGCHTAYPSTGASAPWTGGSPNVTHYRHKTEMFYRDWSNPDTLRLSQNPEENPVTGFPRLRLASSPAVDNGIVTCLTCHRVHGTATVMDGYALKPSVAGLTPATDTGLADEDLTPSQTGSDHTGRLSLSTLLFTNNRGMCQACHQWGVTTESGPD